MTPTPAGTKRSPIWPINVLAVSPRAPGMAGASGLSILNASTAGRKNIPITDPGMGRSNAWRTTSPASSHEIRRRKATIRAVP